MVFNKIHNLQLKSTKISNIKALMIINEPFEKMVLGKNSNLAYILSSLELGFELYIHNLSAQSPLISSDKNPLIPSIKLGKDQDFCDKLIKNFKDLNQEIASKTNIFLDQKVEDFLVDYKIKIADLRKNISLSEIDFVINRPEPMKEPFPPQGKESLNEVLTKIRDKFPQNFVFNCPIELNDKEAAQEINRLALAKNEAEISTPTAEFKIDETEKMLLAIKSMSEKYHDLFPNQTSTKIVIKPKNSAQSLGVFALEFIDEEKSLDLDSIKNTSVKNLQNSQIYRINSGFSNKNLAKLIVILLYIQSLRSEKIELDDLIKNIEENEIISRAKDLYNDEILVQPFLEGIKFGDIRTILLKDEEGNFYSAGSIFRKNISTEQKSNFTTGYSSGRVSPRQTAELTLEEQSDLSKKTTQIIESLNSSSLKQKYQNSIELGLDFILLGNEKNLLLGEINHICVALLPIIEAINEKDNYDGGLSLTKLAILQSLHRNMNL